MSRRPRQRNLYPKREEPAKCPFCDKRVPRPTPIEELTGVSGGTCDCGALFVADETGRGGGQALVDGLTLLCEGDVTTAMGLCVGADYELKDIGYRPRTHSMEPPRPGRGRSFGVPRLYFFKRCTDERQ